MIYLKIQCIICGKTGHRYIDEHIINICESNELKSKYWCDGFKICLGNKQTDDSGKIRATDKAALYYDYVTTYQNDANKKYPFDMYLVLVRQ